MDAEVVDLLVNKVLVLALAVTRIAVAFVILPLFSNELIPATVRNSIFLSFGLITLTVHANVDIQVTDSAQWILLFAKELFIGIGVGVFFGVFLWAFEAAGTIVDTQIGSSIATIFDPISGHEITLIGELLAKWAIYVFVSSGGLILFALSLLESFQQWPLEQPIMDIPANALSLFTAEFSRFMSLTLMIAAPMVVIVFLVDMSMGLVNRFAQQLNVLFLSISIKSLAALLILVALIPVLGQQLIDEVYENREQAIEYIDSMIN